MATFKEIQALFPYQFSGRNIGLDIANGWLLEFEELCKKIDQLLGDDKKGFHWVQLKEKFGSARYYWEMDDYEPGMMLDIISPKDIRSISLKATKSKKSVKDVSEKISKLINVATAKTQEHCICCGAPGKVDGHGGYYLVLCEAHANIQKSDDELDIWPSQSEEEE